MKQHLKKIHRFLTNTTLDFAPNPDAQEFEVNKWALSEFVCEKLVPAVGCHPFPLDELMLLSGSVCRFRPTHIFEWGTNIGKSALVFYETARHFKIDAEIHSIDLPDDVEHVEHPKNNRGKLVRGKPGVSLHLGDGVETALGLCAPLPADSRLLFLVDGDHSYESVQRELGAIFSRLSHPAVLLHDTFFQSPEVGYNIGPNQAISEFLARAENRDVVKVETGLGLPGMTLLYRRAAAGVADSGTTSG